MIESAGRSRSGMQTPNYAEVTSGLTPGEQVVVSDRGGLKAGETVKPANPEALPTTWEGKTQE